MAVTVGCVYVAVWWSSGGAGFKQGSVAQHWDERRLEGIGMAQADNGITSTKCGSVYAGKGSCGRFDSDDFRRFAP